MHLPLFHRLLTRLWERWAERGSAEIPHDDAGARPVLRYNSRYRWTMGGCFVLIVALCWYAWAHPEEFRDDPRWLLWFVRIALSITVAIGLLEVADAFRWSASMSPAALVIDRPFRKRQEIAWDEITAVAEDPRKRQLRISHRRGETRISYQVNGLPQLRRRLAAFLVQD